SASRLAEVVAWVLAQVVPARDSMKLEIITATMGIDGWGERMDQWIEKSITKPKTIVIYNSAHNLGVVGSYDKGYRESTADLLAYTHDDTVIYEPGWDERVIREFEDSSVGVVGFGGAIAHGSEELYKSPYDYHQLGRAGYLSNVNDAEVHGQRFDG